MLQKGQAPCLGWTGQEASKISGASSYRDQGGEGQEGLSHLCAQVGRRLRRVHHGW